MNRDKWRKEHKKRQDNYRCNPSGHYPHCHPYKDKKDHPYNYLIYYGCYHDISCEIQHRSHDDQIKKLPDRISCDDPSFCNRSRFKQHYACLYVNSIVIENNASKNYPSNKDKCK